MAWHAHANDPPARRVVFHVHAYTRLCTAQGGGGQSRVSVWEKPMPGMPGKSKRIFAPYTDRMKKQDAQQCDQLNKVGYAVVARSHALRTGHVCV